MHHQRSRAASESFLRPGPVEELISLAVSHIEVQRGELLWEDKKVPVDFGGSDLALALNYSLLRRQYEAHLLAGSITRASSNTPRSRGERTPRWFWLAAMPTSAI